MVIETGIGWEDDLRNPRYLQMREDRYDSFPFGTHFMGGLLLTCRKLYAGTCFLPLKLCIVDIGVPRLL